MGRSNTLTRSSTLSRSRYAIASQLLQEEIESLEEDEEQARQV
jgi:hypothetical protein